MEEHPMARKKSWREKLHDSKGLPKTGQITPEHFPHWGQGTFVIAAPIEVDAVMREVPRRKLLTIELLREILARRHATTIACPITTGIFAWIAAHAADEDEKEGRKTITPYWRTLKSKGELNPRYPGGIENLRARLETEGHSIIQKGKRFFVKDYETALLQGDCGAGPPLRPEGPRAARPVRISRLPR
jgi:hypothetical protein